MPRPSGHHSLAFNKNHSIERWIGIFENSEGTIQMIVRNEENALFTHVYTFRSST
jgi:hypothetical protein